MESSYAFLVIGALAFVMVTGLVSSGGMSAAQSSSLDGVQAISNAGDDGRVAVGGGNQTVQYYRFDPAVIEISVGESVTWYSPTEFNELHTVTFVQNPSLVSDIILPFSVQSLSASDLRPSPPYNVGEPIMIEMQGSGDAIVALNKIAFYPSVTDFGGQTTQYFDGGTDISYQMNGSEGVLNSGVIQQEELLLSDNGDSSQTTASSGVRQPLEPPFPFVNEFTVTFGESGTYDYFCALHPWMTGQVIVVATQEEVDDDSSSRAGLIDDEDARGGDISADNNDDHSALNEDDQQQQSDGADDGNETSSRDDSQSDRDAALGEQEEGEQEECDPSYPDACIPSQPPDLDCGDVDDTDFAVREPDPHGFDGDNDGVGCET
jgi:plastocyanin